MRNTLGAALLIALFGCGDDATPDTGTDSGFDASVDGGIDVGRVDAGYEFEWQIAAADMLLPYVETGWVPGFSVVVVQDDEVQFLGLGRVDPAVEGEPQPDTIYEIGSVSKPFTGTLLALAVARGDVSHERPLVDLVAEGVTVPTRRSEPIRLVHLASHTSGLGRDAPSSTAFLPPPSGSHWRATNEASFYADLAGATLSSEPGRTFSYSGWGMGWLGFELTRLAGVSTFDELLLGITEPLAMPDTVVVLDAEQSSRLAPPHFAPDEVAPAFPVDILAGAAGMHSTAADLGRWMRAQIDPPEGELGVAVQDARLPRVDRGVDSVGLGWGITRWRGGDLLTHSGLIDGATTMIAVSPESRTGVAIMTNSRIDAAIVRDLTVAVLDEVRGFSWADDPFLLVPTAVPAIDVSVETLEELVGSYQFDTTAIDVVVADDKLFVNFGVRFLRLWPVGEDEFLMRTTIAQVLVVRNGSGAITGLRWMQDGGDNLYARL